MPIDAAKLKTWPFQPIVHTYSARDTILYALGLGLGHDPMDRAQLRFVYEDGLQALPTLGVVLGYPGFWAKDPATGIDWVKLLHGEQSLELLAPLPAEGTVVGTTRVTALVDKGAGKGALMYSERDIHDQASGQLLAVSRSVSFMRGDGGFSATGQISDPSPPPREAVPERAPDAVCELKTRPEAALIYRLSGDYNPVHVDPAVAQAAGFQRPILHGLCSFGVSGVALLKTLCGWDPARLKEIGCRFSSPVYPGETLRVEMWSLGGGRHAFRTRVVERDIVVLSHGSARIAD
ncbi:MAG: MaoC family dehydratase N-terminal domain-containing protein [Burkholderiales bacterium]|nr:MaoC family dehydratase N-terminal domain-containing protein [Burkholderiales bacterium]